MLTILKIITYKDRKSINIALKNNTLVPEHKHVTVGSSKSNCVNDDVVEGS